MLGNLFETNLLSPVLGYNKSRDLKNPLDLKNSVYPAVPENRHEKGWFYMNLAKISANGQITVPAEIRRLLGLKSGDKVLFFQKSSGEVVINNASSQAIYKAQRAFEGVAEQMGVYNDEDVQTLVDEVRIGTSKSALGRDNE